MKIWLNTIEVKDYWDRKSFSVAKATQIANVRPSVCPSQKTLSLSELLLLTIKPIGHWAYQPSSLSTIKPVYNQACLQSSLSKHWPSSLSTIKPIDHQAYQPMSLSTNWTYQPQAYRPSSPLTIMPIDCWSSFATFKPFGLLGSNLNTYLPLKQL